MPPLLRRFWHGTVCLTLAPSDLQPFYNPQISTKRPRFGSGRFRSSYSLLGDNRGQVIRTCGEYGSLMTPPWAAVQGPTDYSKPATPLLLRLRRRSMDPRPNPRQLPLDSGTRPPNPKYRRVHTQRSHPPPQNMDCPWLLISSGQTWASKQSPVFRSSSVFNLPRSEETRPQIIRVTLCNKCTKLPT